MKKENVVFKKEPASGKREGSLPSPKVVIQQRLPLQATNPQRPPVKSSTPTNPTAAVTRPPPQSGPVATPLPSARTKEQDLDATYRRYIYRIGELVWFNRGTAWGLALIVKRDSVSEPQQQGIRSRARYLVQPLSHPYQHPELKLMTSDDMLRPWLAWSAPGPTHRSLTQKSYANIDWKAVVAGQYGPGDAEVDGSIFAAKQVDESLTLVSPLSNNTITTGERTYLALFLGGEKIYIGEPVRLRINQGHDVMVIHQIIEKLKPNSTNINLASVHLVGDVYRYTTIPYDPANPRLPANPHLPARMKADLEFRNSITVPIKRIHSYWNLLQSAVRLSISDLKGRWYESSILLPILRGSNVFAADVQKGEITDVGDWINGRGDANAAAGKTGTRFRERLEAIGKAVPPGLKLGGSDDSGEGGIETATPSASGKAPVRDNAGTAPGDAAQQPQGQVQASPQAQGRDHAAVGSDGDLSQFMNMDKMEE